jgi:uroporphyrinogen III methyltransferase / synthase
MTGGEADHTVDGAGGSLVGRTVLVPRAPEQAGELSDRIRALGGQVVEAPVLLIEPGDADALAGATRELADGGFAAVCFTSPNGVRAVARTLEDVGLDAEVVRRPSLIACVGPGTAQALLDELGLEPDLVPRVSTTEALGVAFPRGEGRVLLPRADLASPVLPELLRAKGYLPVDVIAYRTGRPDELSSDVLDGLADGTITDVVLASPSTAQNLVTLLGPRPLRSRVISIGPVTSAACRRLHLDVAVEASPHDLDGLVEALTRV